MRAVEKDLRGQLKGLRDAHATLNAEHEKLQASVESDRAVAAAAAEATLKAAHKEAEDARKQAASDLKAMKETLERTEGEATRAANLRFEAERSKIRESHRKELARLQASSHDLP